MKITLISATPSAEKIIADGARRSTGSISKGKDHDERLIRNCIRKGHLSVLRHAIATFDIEDISRVCSHQLITHVFLSSTQESQRRVKVNENYIIPENIRNDKDCSSLFDYANTLCYQAYLKLLENGINMQEARYVLPSAFVTSMRATANMEEWRRIISLRMAKDADWEIRILAKEILKILKPLYSAIFHDIEPVVS